MDRMIALLPNPWQFQQWGHSMFKTLTAGAAAALLFAPAALAQAVTSQEVMEAQVAMANRVEAYISERALFYGLNHDTQVYCKVRMYMDTALHPKNGAVPLGVNYNEIRDRITLNLVIGMREAFEKTHMALCLANAKNTFDAAR